MTDSELRDKLLEASGLVDEVNSGLNLRSHKCESCGAVRFENWDDKKSSDWLSAARTRILTALRQLDFPKK